MIIKYIDEKNVPITEESTTEESTTEESTTDEPVTDEPTEESAEESTLATESDYSAFEKPFSEYSVTEFSTFGILVVSIFAFTIFFVRLLQKGVKNNV